MQGTLSEGALPGLLRELYVGRKTGMLSFVSGDERRGVRFRKGNIVRGDTSVTEDRLGETLVRLGLLSPIDLTRATEIVVLEKKRLGTVLVDLGVMDKDRLDDAIAIHVREILLKVFSWSEGTWAFEDQDPEIALDEDLTVRLSTGEMILEAVRRVQDPDVIRYALGDVDRILGLSSDPLLRFQRITLSPADGYLLSRVDGTLSAREVMQLIPMVAEETQRSLLGLLCTGVVEYLPLPPKKAVPAAKAAGAAARPAARPPAPAPPTPARVQAAPAPLPPVTPAAAPSPAAAAAPASAEAATRRQEILEAYEGLKTRTHFEILGIPRASNEAQVKDAYFRLAKRFHPDVQHDRALADLRDTLEAVFIRLGEAYEVLRNPRTRSSYESDLVSRMPRRPLVSSPSGTAGEAPAADPQFEARMVEETIRRAEKRFVEEKFWDVIQLLEPTIPKATGKQQQRARVLLARAYLKNPHWVKRAEEMLQTVVHDDPKCADAYFVLGNIYKGSGLKSRAITMYRKVVELRPESEEAAAEVAALGGRADEQAPESSEGGLLKKLFGRT
jgi:tetratricopeptide (TPR) repeat protein